MAEQRTGFIQGVASKENTLVQRAALRSLVQFAQSRDVQVMIFQGRINPVLDEEPVLAARVETARFLHQLGEQEGVTFIPLSEQDVSISANEWADMTHFDQAGREKWTRYLASYLRGFR